jgi:YidC/Oxa1 family membrane protein insertase
MAEKVPSFKGGGAYWFVDLTTPDTLYILPVLTALSFLITVEVGIFLVSSFMPTFLTFC